MTDLERCISDLTTFIQTDVFLTLEEGVKGSIIKRKEDLCKEYMIGVVMSLNRNKIHGCYAPHKPVMIISVMELISRVKALLRRTLTEEVKELKLDELAINNEKHEVSIDGQIIELTYKEYELLSLFIMNKGIVLTRDTIMDQVWGTDYEGESRTIDMHVKTLRQKLGEYGARIKTIRNVGYVIE